MNSLDDDGREQQSLIKTTPNQIINDKTNSSVVSVTAAVAVAAAAAAAVAMLRDPEGQSSPSHHHHHHLNNQVNYSLNRNLNSPTQQLIDANNDDVEHRIPATLIQDTSSVER